VVALAPGIAASGGAPPEWLLDRVPAARAADAGALTTVAVAVAGYYTDQGRRPPPEGIRDPRPSQAAQGRAALSWIRRRTGWA
jgi:hypothetical protein